MSNTLTRKQWNRAAADFARGLGAYSTVMDAWNTLDRSLTPEHAVARVLVALAPADVPAAPVKAPEAGKARSRKAPAAKAPARTAHLTGTIAKRNVQVATPAEQIRAAVNRANAHAQRMDADFGHGYCGNVRVTVYVDGRTAAAKALREAGFHRAGTGAYEALVCGAQNLTANEIAAEQAVYTIRRVLPDVDVYTSSYGD